MRERNLRFVGTSSERVDGVDKVTGRAKYVGDILVPGMVVGKFLCSPYAHARILSVNTAEAERVPSSRRMTWMTSQRSLPERK